MKAKDYILKTQQHRIDGVSDMIEMVKNDILRWQSAIKVLKESIHHHENRAFIEGCCLSLSFIIT